MNAPASSVNGHPSGGAINAAGTQFALFHQAPSSTGRTGGTHMAAKVAIIIASAVALTPAIAALAWTNRADAVLVSRSVELSGPILSFTQSQERIQVRLVPAAENEQRREVVVRAAAGDASQSIPLKPGQTWASAKLSAELAHSPALEISVE
jgi:hypothetical protein